MSGSAFRLLPAALVSLVFHGGFDAAELHGEDAAGRLQQCTVRILSQTDRSSGVIISDSGLILTSAHGIHGDAGRVDVVFANGTVATATVQQKDNSRDLAILQLPEDAPRPAAALALNARPATQDLVLAVGCPGREANGLAPVLRLGSIISSDGRVIRSSCTLTSGDSGGPLFNQHGHVIGIHRQIGAGVVSNLHIGPILIREFLNSAGMTLPNAAASGVEVVQLPDQELCARVAERRDQWSVRIERDLPHVASSSDRDSADPQDFVNIAGTRLDRQHVATKLSELKGHQRVRCRLANGKDVVGVVARVDRLRDLAVLEHEPAGDPQLQTAAVQVGDVLLASAELSTGIVARIEHTEPGVAPKLGVSVAAAADGGLVVSEVAPNSFAFASGLQPADRLVELDGQPVGSFEAVNAVLSDRQPGDWMMVTADRSSERLRRGSALKADAAEQFALTEFLDGRAGRLSHRRTGFEGVIQHDIPISPEECGGPLLDHHGNLVGINIARRARESTLAIPIETVLEWLNATDR